MTRHTDTTHTDTFTLCVFKGITLSIRFCLSLTALRSDTVVTGHRKSWVNRRRGYTTSCPASLWECCTLIKSVPPCFSIRTSVFPSWRREKRNQPFRALYRPLSLILSPCGSAGRARGLQRQRSIPMSDQYEEVYSMHLL